MSPSTQPVTSNPEPTSPPSKRPRLSPSKMSSNLTVSYSSPTSQPFEVKHELPAPHTDKTAFLVALREKITATQEQVNKELTARMEEDKLRENGKIGVDDVKEEENYGEEVQEEED